MVLENVFSSTASSKNFLTPAHCRITVLSVRRSQWAGPQSARWKQQPDWLRLQVRWGQIMFVFFFSALMYVINTDITLLYEKKTAANRKVYTWFAENTDTKNSKTDQRTSKQLSGILSKCHLFCIWKGKMNDLAAHRPSWAGFRQKIHSLREHLHCVLEETKWGQHKTSDCSLSFNCFYNLKNS